MHWHAIRQSRDQGTAREPEISAYNPTDLAEGVERFHLDGNDSRYKEDLSLLTELRPCSIGDDACDLKPGLEEVSGRTISELGASPQEGAEAIGTVTKATSSEILRRFSNKSGPLAFDRGSQASSSSGSRASRLTAESLRSLNSSFSPSRAVDERSKTTVEAGRSCSTRTTASFLHVDMPTHAANNMAPFAYQRALRNRIRDDELGPGRKYDIKAYTPMFVHDCLMVPGSLANVPGKGSAEDVVRRMTPALLPDFRAHAHAATHEPLILQSSKPGDHVKGMLVFGQSRHVRRSIHEHYRASCKRIKVEVELDTVHPVPAHLRKFPGERWELRRTGVWAHAWIWRNASSADARFRLQADAAEWLFDDYLAGKHEPAQSLRIEPAGWIEDDRETIASSEEPTTPEHWSNGGDEPTGEWQAGSEEGAAVPWDDHAWDTYEHLSEPSEQDDYYIDRGALDRDYDRSGNAGCW